MKIEVNKDYVFNEFIFHIFQTKPKLVEPLDYETVLVKNRTILHNDPQRELLIFPYDDVSVSIM